MLNTPVLFTEEIASYEGKGGKMLGGWCAISKIHNNLGFQKFL